MAADGVVNCPFRSIIVTKVLPAVLIGLVSGGTLTATEQAGKPKLLPGAQGPKYPAEAESKMIVGDVVFRADVSEDGTVKSVHFLQVPEKDLGFEEAVEESVRGWKFEPAQNGGAPVASIYVGKVGFSLRPDDEKAIQQAVEQAAEAWNKGDAKKLASRFEKTEGRIHAKQELAKSSKKVQEWFSGQLKGAYKDSQIDLFMQSIQFFPAPDLALIQPRFSMAAAGADGTATTRGRLSVLLTKSNGRWSALRGQLVELEGTEELLGPRKVKEVSPEYPEEARSKGIAGTVVLEAMVGQDGQVKDVEVIRSVPSLDEAAIEAAKKWEYEPARLGGQPTEMSTTMTVNFTLE